MPEATQTLNFHKKIIQTPIQAHSLKVFQTFNEFCKIFNNTYKPFPVSLLPKIPYSIYVLK